MDSQSQVSATQIIVSNSVVAFQTLIEVVALRGNTAELRVNNQPLTVAVGDQITISDGQWLVYEINNNLLILNRVR